MFPFKHIILASKSPRRKQLLKQIGINFSIEISGIDETIELDLSPHHIAENLSKVGTQPIIGTQILFNYKEEIGLLSLIAKSENGYKRIVELSSKSYLNNNKSANPQCSFEELVKEPNDIILYYIISNRF